MRAALRRDHYRCRWPNCEYAKLDLPIDACHETHRGMGGNPKLDRTTRQTVLALCRIHHGLWDRGEITITPLTREGFDGPIRCRS